MEYLAIDHIYPDWKMWIDFIAGEQEAGLRLDSLANSHQVEVPIKHPDEIKAIFDTISYSKARAYFICFIST